MTGQRCGLPANAARRERSAGGVVIHITGGIAPIDWFFRFRGQLIHKVCHFFLMKTTSLSTCPQRAEGITAWWWTRFDEADGVISHANARDVLRRARDMVVGSSAPAGP